jgi:F0F1-type ATP synthase assembly protein I
MQMKQTAAKRQTTRVPVDDTLDHYAEDLAGTAKRQFVGATMNMGVRLAVTVVVPIVLGVKIDEHFKTSPSFTLLGIMVATVAGCVAVWSTIKEVNKEQADQEAEQKQSKGRVKRAK